jgi:hypothetical protein
MAIQNMKKTICALALSLAACQSPVVLQPEGGEAIEIPVECTEVKSYMITYGPVHNLNCKDNQGEDLYFKFNNDNDTWKKYNFVRKDYSTEPECSE